jgi:hypothetical protein
MSYWESNLATAYSTIRSLKRSTPLDGKTSFKKHTALEKNENFVKGSDSFLG